MQHDLHMAIDRAFREVGITIAFPQRDVHIKAAPQTPLPFEQAAGEPPVPT